MSKRPLSTRLLIIAAAVLAAGGAYVGAGAFGNTQATYNVGGIDLKIDSTAFYNTLPYPKSTWTLKDLKPYYDHFFDFNDVKPGDTGTTTISIHTTKGSSYVCLYFKDFKDEENGRNEPELLVDATDAVGELGKGLKFFAWFDDGDNKFEVGEKPLFGTTTQEAIQTVKDTMYPLADYLHGPTWLAGSTHYVGIAWCAGEMAIDFDTAAISCDGEALGNEAQTDSLSFSVMLEAVSSTDQKKFVCGGKVEQCDMHDNDHEYSHNDYDGKDRDGDGKDHDWKDDQDDHDGKDWDKDGKDHDGKDDPEDKCEEEKEKICHHTGSKSNPTEIIEVSKNALGAHIENHGDYVIEDKDDEKSCNDEKKDKDKDKVKICHYTGSYTNPTNIIEVSKSAVKAHVKEHGDFEIKNKYDEKKCDDEKKKHEYSYFHYDGDKDGYGGACLITKK